jgi:hypothetical protein
MIQWNTGHHTQAENLYCEMLGTILTLVSAKISTVSASSKGPVG